jgi:hypothetical protein
VIETRQARESEGVRVPGLLAFAVGLVALGVVVQVVLAFAMGGFSREEARLRTSAAPHFKDEVGPFPAPRLQSDPASELAHLRQDELARLSRYGWMDKKAGVAKIPIERAMEIVAQKGLPAPEPASAGAIGSSSAARKASPEAADRPDSKREPKR